MTDEQIADLRGMVKVWWRHTREEVEALEAAIALAEQTCETCAYYYERDCRKAVIPWCYRDDCACERYGNRCGNWKKKDYEGPRP